MAPLFTRLPMLFIALAPITHAANLLHIHNSCSYPLYFWTVQPLIHIPDTQHNIVNPHTTHTHAMLDLGPASGGISLKMRDIPHYEVAPAGILQVEYKLSATDPDFWYDLSRINCDVDAKPDDALYCPFIQGGVRMWTSTRGDGRTCPEASCKGKKCERTYEKHGFWLGEPTHNCPVGHDVHFEVCTHGDAPVTFGKGNGMAKTVGGNVPPTQSPSPFRNGTGLDTPKWRNGTSGTRIESGRKLYTVEQCWAMMNGSQALKGA